MRPGCFGSLCCWLGRRRQVDSLGRLKFSKKGLKRFGVCGEVAVVQAESQGPSLPAPPHFEHPVCKDTIQEEALEQRLDSLEEEASENEVPETCPEEPQESQCDEEEHILLSPPECGPGNDLENSCSEQLKSVEQRDCPSIENSGELSEASIRSVRKAKGIMQLFRKPPSQGTNNDDQRLSPVAANTSSPKNGALVDCEILTDGQLGDVTIPKGKLRKSLSFPALQWMLKPPKQPQSPQASSDEDPQVSERQVSASSAPTRDAESDIKLRLETRGKGGFPCFWWSQSLQSEDDDGDEIIQEQDVDDGHELTPPGLVGLQNLGNTCFLNTALQCLRCTPRLAELVVPELEDGFRDDITVQLSLDSEHSFIWKRGIRSFSVPQNFESCKYEIVTVPNPIFDELSPTIRQLDDDHESVKIVAKDSLGCSRSSSTVLPSNLGSQWRAEDKGLVGGSSAKQTNESRIWKAAKESFRMTSGDVSLALSPFAQREKYVTANVLPSETTASYVNVGLRLIDRKNEQERNSIEYVELSLEYGTPLDAQNCGGAPCISGIIPKGSSTYLMDKGPLIDSAGDAPKDITAVDACSTLDIETKIGDKATDERIQGEGFIAAFRKTMLATCMLPAESSFNPKTLFKRLSKLPMGDIYCDGGQHDCQEILEVLLNHLHEQLKYGTPLISAPAEGALPVASSNEDGGAKALWTQYLERDGSPITDLFAGQLQIVRTCQKCSTKTMTYEPFWELSLPLQKERTGWFGGRAPSTIEDLLRAFTSGEILQGDNSPYCETCKQKTPATRRMQIHRFPPILILHIKRFKHTCQGREKLTAAITYPLRDLKLQSFGSHEGKMDSSTSCSYNLYASSNHFGTLSGGHYTATCKVKDQDKKEAWYCFNDQTVMRISENEVVSPSAYVLFYARRRRKPQTQ